MAAEIPHGSGAVPGVGRFATESEKATRDAALEGERK